MKQPNILFIMTDQMRGDCMGISGHPDVKTPYLDDLAAKGILYTNAYTAVPSCIAARCGLHTGLSQEHHGRIGYRDGVAWEYEHTMAGELSKCGYYTQCVGKMHVHPLRNLMGFHNIELHDGYLHGYRNVNLPYFENQCIADDYFYWLKNELGISADVMDTGIDCNSFIARPWIYEEKYHPTNWVTDRSIDFLRRRDRSKPFFLMSSYVRPHPPFDAPQCYFDMYNNMELTKPLMGDWADEDRLKLKGRFYDSDTGSIDSELMRQAQVGYYACISHLDNQIGKLISSLKEDGSFNNTVIIFTSDHGELLGDHHTYRKVRPHQGSVHIPMIISGKDIKAGEVSDQLVELRDIMPTTLDLAGGTVPSIVDGMSILHENNREYIHGEHSGGDIGNQYIVTKTDKFCWFTQTGKEQYFDLKHDPKELHDGINDNDFQDRISYLRNILIKELKDRPEKYTDGKRLISTGLNAKEWTNL
ncbi:MAG: arylsulfatase [Oscillospiraceae bacterium]